MRDIYEYQSTHLDKSNMFDFIIDNIEMGYVCLEDNEAFDFHYVHPIFPKIMGFSLEEFRELAKNGFLSLVLKEDRDSIVQMIRDNQEIGSYCNGVYRLVKRSGENMWCFVRVRRDVTEDGQIHLRCLIRDVDVIERGRREILKSKVLLDNIYSDQIVGVISTYCRGKDCGIDVINDMVPRLYGYDSTEELMSDIKNFRIGHVLEEDSILMEERSAKLKNQGDMHDMDVRVRYKDGSIHILHIYTKLIISNEEERSIQRIIVDVTQDRKNRELQEVLSRTQSRYRVFDIVAHHSQNAYVLFSEKDLTVYYVSPNMYRLTGIPAESIKQLPDIFTDDFDVSELWTVLPLVTADESVPKKTRRVHKVTGEQKYFIESLYRTTFDDEERILLVIADRTKEKRSQSALEIALENAEQANRAKTSFLSDMSHDLRTPMNAISGLITLIKAEIDNPKKIREHLDLMEKSSNNMLELINNILDMSRIESGHTVLEYEPFSVEEVCEEVIAIHRPQGQLKGIVLEKNFELSSKIYQGDRLRIMQILSNLISNAVKYTMERGKIELSVKSRPITDTEYETICLTLKDTGIGMSKEFLENLFVPFSREKNTTMSGVGGTGLGMPIVKNLVEIMNGNIWVESKQGEGTTFTVEIPLRPIHEEGIKKNIPSEKTPIDLRGVRVLVVEDNLINAEILLELLEMEGMICDWVTDGRKALEKLGSEHPDTYDFVLMDVQMPVMNGYEATKAIRQSNHPRAKTIPIAAMTANAFQEDVRNALEAGMDVHIAKPVNMELLKETMARLLKR